MQQSQKDRKWQQEEFIIYQINSQFSYMVIVHSYERAGSILGPTLPLTRSIRPCFIKIRSYAKGGRDESGQILVKFPSQEFPITSLALYLKFGQNV